VDSNKWQRWCSSQACFHQRLLEDHRYRPAFYTGSSTFDFFSSMESRAWCVIL
jgi:hypothetical protein